jgi:hypothetical protein
MSTRRGSFIQPVALLLFLALLGAACDDPTLGPQPLYPGDIRTFVTAEVAAQLTPEGTFPLAAAAPEPYPQISREKAAEFAVAWARTYGSFMRPYLERDHGRRIDFHALEVVSPVWYAATVYEPVPAAAHPGDRNSFGPHYLLYLGTGSEPVLGVSVAAFAESYIDAEGNLADPPESGNEVVVYGVAPGDGFSAPVSPEQAAYITATATGARVAAVPELINPHRDYHPYLGRWRVTLDRSVSVRERSSNAVRSVRELYVAPDGELQIPAPVQQDSAGGFRLREGGTFSVRRRAERPVLFVPVSPNAK